MARLALVTGGTTGIGAATCKALKAAGHTVIANYFSDDAPAQKFAQETGVKVYKWNVSDYKQCEESIKKIESDLGATIDILVNNAGITRDSMMHKMPVEHWDAVILTDLSAAFYMARTVITAMRAKNYGRIVSISSINAQMGQIGQTNYCAAKAGIIGFSKALARESAPKGITVNVVAPGYTNTEMVKTVPEEFMKSLIAQVPMGRLGEPSDIANAITFLASDKASYITGEVISVNGGHHME
jgi:acetoacetyl-CoA reductase